MRKPRIRKPRERYYAFVFTNHKFISISEELHSLESHCLFAVAGLELCPKTGKQHLQGYFYLKEPRTKGKARRLLKNVHIEPARECPVKNFLYCTKGNNFRSIGSITTASKSWKSPLLTC